MRNDANCNEVIQRKGGNLLELERSFIRRQKDIDSKNSDAKSDAVHELEKLLKNLTPAKLKASLNLEG